MTIDYVKRQAESFIKLNSDLAKSMGRDSETDELLIKAFISYLEVQK